MKKRQRKKNSKKAVEYLLRNCSLYNEEQYKNLIPVDDTHLNAAAVLDRHANLFALVLNVSKGGSNENK